MNHTRQVFTAIAAALTLAAGLLPAADRPPAKPDYRERYGVLADRNIFLKDRTKPASAGGSGTDTTFATTREASTKPAPETAYVLTGIVEEEGQYRAYVEDVPNSKVLRLNVGDAVAAGRVAAIEIDAVAYESGGRQTWVDVGRDLTGASFNSFAAAPPTTGPAATAPSTGAPINISTGNLSVEEKMRLRRAQELKRK